MEKLIIKKIIGFMKIKICKRNCRPPSNKMEPDFSLNIKLFLRDKT